MNNQTNKEAQEPSRRSARVHDDLVGLEVVARNLRSAKVIAIVANTICAFLSILVFEIAFGWQGVRPGASTRIFADKLAELASVRVAATCEDSTQNPLTRGIVLIARREVCEILGAHQAEIPADTCSGSLDSALWISSRQDLYDSLSNAPTWKQEEHIRSFVSNVEGYRTALAKRREGILDPSETSVTERPAPSTAEPQFTVSGTSPEQSEPSNNSDYTPSGSSTDKGSVININAHFDRPASGTTKAGIRQFVDLLALDVRASFAYQEIYDRFQVNENVRGRHLASRKYTLPMLGITAQMEDIGVPCALFLLLLTIWLSAALNNALSSATSYFTNAPKSETKKAAASLMRIFYFMNLDHSLSGKDYPRYNYNIIWLLLAPYFVVASDIVVDLHETFFVCSRYHGSEWVQGDPTSWAFLFKILLLIPIVITLACMAYRMFSRHVSLFQQLNMCLNPGKGDPSEKHAVASLFYWLLSIPWVVFGLFMLAYNINGIYTAYFLNWYWMILYVVALSVFGMIIWLLFRRLRSEGEQSVGKASKLSDRLAIHLTRYGWLFSLVSAACALWVALFRIFGKESELYMWWGSGTLLFLAALYLVFGWWIRQLSHTTSSHSKG